MQQPPAVRRIGDPTIKEEAEFLLDKGECIVFPTDTVYGIASRADNRAAVAKLQQIKGRSDAFPPPILVGDADAAWALFTNVPESARRLGEAYWPGGLTLILATGQHLSLSEQVGTIGVRVPAHDEVRALLRMTGPLAVSSANKHSSLPATTVEEAIAQLGDEVGLYIDGGPTPGLTPSTVVDCTTEPVTIVRLGLLTSDQIYSIAGGGDA